MESIKVNHIEFRSNKTESNSNCSTTLDMEAELANARQLIKDDNCAEALAILEHLADLNYGPAQIWLGSIYTSGLFGITKNPEIGLDLYQRAAEGGSIMMCAHLGEIFLNGVPDVNKNYDLAFYWFDKGTQLGSASPDNDKATNQILANIYDRLGLMYQHGLGIEKDLDKSFAWFNEAHQLKAPDASRSMEMITKERQAFEFLMQKNYRDACGLFNALADDGLAIAQLQLGLIYMVSPNVTNYMVLALHGFTLADKNQWKTPKIAFALGKTYMEIPDQFRSKDHVRRALANYQIAAQGGSKNAELKCGQLLADFGSEYFLSK